MISGILNKWTNDNTQVSEQWSKSAKWLYCTADSLLVFQALIHNYSLFQTYWLSQQIKLHKNSIFSRFNVIEIIIFKDTRQICSASEVWCPLCYNCLTVNIQKVKSMGVHSQKHMVKIVSIWAHFRRRYNDLKPLNFRVLLQVHPYCSENLIM